MSEYDDEGTEADYLDSLYSDEHFSSVNDDDEDGGNGGEFVIHPFADHEEFWRLVAAGNAQRPRSAAEREADRQKSYQDKRDLYEVAKTAKVGEMIACPNCKKMHKKTTYHKIFCNNQKTHPGKRSCKDRYWNTVDEKRRDRARSSAEMQGKL
jgi:hypothetical protein